MGGVMALYTALKWQPLNLHGVIASSPAIRPAMEIPQFVVTIGRLVSNYFGHLCVSGQEKGKSRIGAGKVS